MAFYLMGLLVYLPGNRVNALVYDVSGGLVSWRTMTLTMGGVRVQDLMVSGRRGAVPLVIDEMVIRPDWGALLLARPRGGVSFSLPASRLSGTWHWQRGDLGFAFSFQSEDPTRLAAWGGFQEMNDVTVGGFEGDGDLVFSLSRGAVEKGHWQANLKEISFLGVHLDQLKIAGTILQANQTGFQLTGKGDLAVSVSGKVDLSLQHPGESPVSAEMNIQLLGKKLSGPVAMALANHEGTLAVSGTVARLQWGLP